MNVALRRAGSALLALVLVAHSGTVLAEDGKPAAGEPAKETQPLSVAPPVDMDGVLLEDGRQIEGTFEEFANQRWVIRPKAGGQPMNVSAAQIVIAEKGGEVELKGEESAAGEIWRAAIRAASKSAAADEAGKSAQIALIERGVAWCTKRGFTTAATSLLNDIARLDPAKSADVLVRAKALMPEGFFFKDKPDPVVLWTKWADKLLPSSAQFVDRADEDVWSRLENKPWTDGATLCFRTTNVLLFIREMDPAVCGKALRLAEQTVRALQVFLNDGEPDVVTGDASRLEIRIHKSRADYLAEEPARGKKAEEWTAGFYSPMENVSHFYVDRRRGGQPDMVELTRVLTHEFTHHYITSRWVTRIITARGAHATQGAAGFWVVEGMAEFVQNQSQHMEERGPRFDDDKVLGNDATAQFRKAGIKSRCLDMETFIDMTQGDFGAMSNEPLGAFKLLHSPGMHGGSEKSLYYDQAGALTYFFLQKKGPEMRKKFVRYVSDHYAGNSHKPAWKYFGYSSVEELDKDFTAFLKTIGG